MEAQRGWSLAEALIVLCIVAVVSAVTMSFAGTMRRRLVVRAATAEIRSAFVRARGHAVARNCSVGVKFRPAASGWVYEVYEDGDGDGVRNDDINAGRDRLIRPARQVFSQGIARIQLPPHPLPDPTSLQPLQGLSPVRFGISTICSFSRRGEATSGSIYLTDGVDTFVVRVYGGTGHIRTLRFDPGSRRWMP